MYQLNHDPLTELERELEKLRSLPTPRQQKKQEAQKKEIDYLITKIEQLKAFYALNIGDNVTNGKKLGIITDLTFSNGGMPQVWVKWDNSLTIPETVNTLKPEPHLKNLKIGDYVTSDNQTYKIKEFKGNGLILIENGQTIRDFTSKSDPENSNNKETIEVQDNEIRSNNDEKTVEAQGLRPSDETEHPSTPQISQLSPETNPNDRLSELTDEEEKDRLFLERKVERAFYEAGKALMEIRDRRLYRNTHKTFEEYCLDRFGFKRRHPYQLINAALVVDNLLSEDSSMCAIGAQNPMSTNGAQTQSNEMTTIGAQNDSSQSDSENSTIGAQKEPDEMCPSGAQNDEPPMTTNGLQNPPDEMCTNGAQILPTSERQIRPLTKLDPQQQREVWREAVAAAGGKVPSSRIVSDIVTRLKPKKTIPNPYRVGEVITILVKENPDLRGKRGCWGIITAVHDFSCTVHLWDGEYTLQIQHLQEMSLSPNQREEMTQIADRISSLYNPNLEDTAKNLLSSLGKINRPYLTPLEEQLLSVLEQLS